MVKDKRAEKLYNQAKHRDRGQEYKDYQKKYYQEHREELLAKAREKAAERKEQKKQKELEDRKNGIWNF